MRRLEGKVILVAGAGGIDGGLARRYAAEGAQIVLGDINLASAEEVVGEIEKAGEAIARAFLKDMYSSPPPSVRQEPGPL